MNIPAKRFYRAAFVIFGLAAATTATTWMQAPAWAQGAAPAAARPQTDYAHMTMKVDKLAEDFYTITGLNGTGRTGGAIGTLTGPDGIFMVDDTFAPLTDKVLAAVRTFSDARIRFIVNAHSHGDHTGGNVTLAKMGATILARPELRAALAAQKNFDPAGLPAIAYTTPVTIHMDGEEVLVIPLPPAHTDGDSMVYFRRADVLMTGDIFRAGYPNIGGTVDGMIQALSMAVAVCGPNTRVVPGHGPVGGRMDLLAHKDMLVAVRDRVAELIRQGKSQEEVIAAHPTADFDKTFLSNVAPYYDEGNIERYKTPDAFLKQVYALLKSKS
jgi:cyclase